ncbi:MAG: response regulator [Pirellulales bacterium]|nr:response regulator [Pirellulales bacterium]
MPHSLPSQSHIVVADSRPKDYRNLTVVAGEHGWHVHFLTSARAAIHFGRPSCTSLWMVNVTLPDMSGFELLDVLRERVAETPVFVVADRYDIDDERRACRNGAALYVVKDAAGAIDCRPLLEVLIGRQMTAERHTPVVAPARG